MTTAPRGAVVVVVTLLMVLSPVVGSAGAVAQAAGGDLDRSTDSRVNAEADDGRMASSEATTSSGDDESASTSGGGDDTATTSSEVNESATTRQADDDGDITFVEPDETTFTEVEYEPNYTVPFWSGPFTPEPGLDPAVTDTARDRVWVLVQFEVQPDGATLDRLAEYEYQDAERLTHTTRYAGIPTDAAEDIVELDGVRAITRIRPEWKVKPSFDRTVEETGPDDTVSVTVLTFEGITTEGTELREVEPNTYRGSVSPETVRELQEDPRVLWIDEFVPPDTTVSEGRRLVGAQMAERPGFGSRSAYTGAGVRVGVLDTGIRSGHPHYSSTTVVHAYDWGDGDYDSTSAAGCAHGQHVAGTIAGSGTDSNRGTTIRGVAPDATLVVSRIFDDNCDWATQFTGPKRKFKQVNDEGADIISNSWGDTAEASDGDYDVQASKTDTWAKHHPDTLLVFANGNFNQPAAASGTVPASDQYVNSPGLAKNVIAVGATRDGSNQTSGNVTDGQVGTVNADSSLNNLQPSEDMDEGSGRRKPELYAPGHWITAPETTGYGERWGTSMATPHVSGVAAMLKEKHPNMGANALRAELVATAAPPNHEGYGIVNANNALHRNTYESRHEHMSNSIKKGQTDTKSFTITQDTEKLVVALTWLDPGHTPTVQSMGSGIMANDLHLTVDGPDGSRTVTTDSNVKRVVIDDPSQGTWTIEVHGHRVSAFTSQDYDVVYRTVTEKPTLDVEESRTVEVQPWEDREQRFTFNVSGTGAPVSGIYLDGDFSSFVMSACDGWDEPTVVGMLSDRYDYTESVCVDLPAPSTTKRTYSVNVSVNTSNAEQIDGQPAQNVTRSITFEVLPRPDADRFDDPGTNDGRSAATNVTSASVWDHTHLRCVEPKPFNDGVPKGGDCSGVLDGGDQYKAREHWQTGLENLSLHVDSDEDYYEVSVPSTHTPKLPNPECGEQNVTIRGDKKRIKTEGQLIIEVSPTENTLGEAKVRTDPSGTPINVYDDSGRVTAGTTSLGYWGDELNRIIPCPRNEGLDEFTFSFGEGSLKNIGSYEIEVHYIIDITRVDDYSDAQEKLYRQVEKAKKIERQAVFEDRITGDGPIDEINEDLIDQFGGDDDGRPSCYTHCGYPGGPPRDFWENRDVVLNFDNDEGEIVDQSRITLEDGAVTSVERDVDSGIIGESVDACSGERVVDAGGVSDDRRSVDACTGLYTARLISASENPQPAMASAYRQGLVRFGGPGFLDGLYVGGPTIELRADGSAAVTTQATYDLTDDEDAERFHALQEDGEFQDELVETYQTRMDWVADDWASEVDREMAVRDARIEFSVRENEDGAVGVASLTVEWTGFAARTDDGLVVERPFASGFVTDQPMVVRGPDGYELESASLEPASVEGATAEWESGTRMADFGVRFVGTGAGTTEPTTTEPSPGETESPPTGTITTTEESTPTVTPTGVPGFGLGVAVIALLAAVVLARRRD